MKKPVIIGIAGGSASGKTSIAQELYDCFKAVSYTHLDVYKRQL